jgi:hypothetical protein
MKEIYKMSDELWGRKAACNMKAIRSSLFLLFEINYLCF